jgi:hypothetical protein
MFDRTGVINQKSRAAASQRDRIKQDVEDLLKGRRPKGATTEMNIGGRVRARELATAGRIAKAIEAGTPADVAMAAADPVLALDDIRGGVASILDNVRSGGAPDTARLNDLAGRLLGLAGLSTGDLPVMAPGAPAMLLAAAVDQIGSVMMTVSTGADISTCADQIGVIAAALLSAAGSQAGPIGKVTHAPVYAPPRAAAPAAPARPSFPTPSRPAQPSPVTATLKARAAATHAQLAYQVLQAAAARGVDHRHLFSKYGDAVDRHPGDVELAGVAKALIATPDATCAAIQKAARSPVSPSAVRIVNLVLGQAPAALAKRSEPHLDYTQVPRALQGAGLPFAGGFLTVR